MTDEVKRDIIIIIIVCLTIIGWSGVVHKYYSNSNIYNFSYEGDD